MKNIKNYEEFNEELNWKKAVVGAAFGAGLAFVSPAHSQTIKQDIITQTISNPKITSELDSIKIEGFRDYKLGDTTIYGESLNKYPVDKLIFLPGLIKPTRVPEVLPEIVSYNNGERIDSKLTDILSNIGEHNIKWYVKKDELLSENIDIFFCYINDKLAIIYINCYEIFDEDIIELLEFKFKIKSIYCEEQEVFRYHHKYNRKYISIDISEKGILYNNNIISIMDKNIITKYKEEERRRKEEENRKKEEERINKIHNEEF